MTVADELRAMADAHEAGASVEPWRPIVEALFKPAPERNAEAKCDRLIAKKKGDWSVPQTVSVLCKLYGFTVEHATNVVNGKLDSDVNAAARERFNEMMRDARASERFVTVLLPALAAIHSVRTE